MKVHEIRKNTHSRYAVFAVLTSLHFTSPLLYCTLLYCTVLYSTVLYCTVLYSTLLYSTLLYSTLLYSTLLYSHLFSPKLKLYKLWIIFLQVGATCSVSGTVDYCGWHEHETMERSMDRNGN